MTEDSRLPMNDIEDIAYAQRAAFDDEARSMAVELRKLRALEQVSIKAESLLTELYELIMESKEKAFKYPVGMQTWAIVLELRRYASQPHKFANAMFKARESR